MEYKIHDFTPKRFFEYFEEISAIPRSSGNEKAISDYLVRFANERDLPVYQDAIWNVIIKKPASQGCAHLPAVMLQGHQDMVCEKNGSTVHDFTSEGICLVPDGDWLRAKGTTLGADNGVAVALMLALLADDSFRHPPLECVFTVQEETGLAGAINLNSELLSARTMINLDSEDEGVATVSCAGGMRVNLRRDCEWESADETGLSIRIRGLLGGHSGGDIHLERGNANKLMSRILAHLLEDGVSYRIAELSGGSKDNAIPRECDCCLSLATAEDCRRATEIILTEAEEIKNELAATEPDFHIETQSVRPERAMSTRVSTDLTELLFFAPNGAQNHNLNAGGFVICSLNLGILRTEKDQLIVTFAPRSSTASLQKQTRRGLTLLGKRLGFQVEVTSEYPGWAYAEHSPIREVFQACYLNLTGQELKCEAIHAGLECGLFLEKMPGLDAIAVGPQVNHCHTPDEELDMPSCERTYRLITAVLEKLCP